MNTPNMHITRSGSIYINDSGQSLTLSPTNDRDNATLYHTTQDNNGYNNNNGSTSSHHSTMMHQSDMDSKYGEVSSGSLLHHNSMRLRSPLTIPRSTGMSSSSSYRQNSNLDINSLTVSDQPHSYHRFYRYCVKALHHLE